MPLLRATAELMSEDDMESGVIEELIDKDDLFALLPFKPIDGKAYTYRREDTIDRPQWISPVVDTVPEGAATFTDEVARLHVLAGDVYVDKFLDTTMSDKNSQWGLQMQMKVKGMAQEFRETLITGDNGAIPKQPDGLPNMIDPAMVLNGGGAAVTFEMLDELLDMVPNGADALMMSRRMLRAYKAMVRAAGLGNTSDLLMLEDFGRPLLTHDGVPIVVNDYIPHDEGAGTGTSIYALRLNEVDGFHGIYAGGADAGIVVEDIGTVQNKDATRTRVKWYTGFALKSTKSCARLSDLLS